MKKKMLVVLVAILTLFVFSVVASAAENTPAEGTAVTFSVGGQTCTAEYNSTNGYTGTIYLDAVPQTDKTVNVTVKVGEESVSTTPSTSDSIVIEELGKHEISGTLIYKDGSDYQIPFKLTVYVGSDEAELLSITPTGTDLGKGSYDDAVIKPSGYTATMYVDKEATKWSFKVTASEGAEVKIDGTGTDTITNGNKSRYNIVITPANGGEAKTYTLNISQTYNVAEFTAPLKWDTTTIASADKMNEGGQVNFTYPYSAKDEAKYSFTTQWAGEMKVFVDSRYDDMVKAKTTDNGFEIQFIDDPSGIAYVYVELTSRDGDSDNDIQFRLKLEQGDPVLLDDMDIMIGSNNSRNDLAYEMYPASFDDEVYDYYLFVPWDSDYKTAVKVYVNAQFDTAFDVTCGGKDLEDNEYIEVGSVNDGDDNTFNVQVSDGVDRSEYSIHVFYGAEKAADVATLDDIEVRYGTSYRTKATLSPSFTANVYNYTVNLPVETKAIRLYLDPKDRDAKIICNEQLVDDYITFNDLKAGVNTYKVTVFAEDRDTYKTYNVTVNVGGSGLLSKVTFTTNLGAVNFSPVFAGDTYNYVANVANSATSIYVTPTALDSDYSILVYRGAYESMVVDSGKTSSAISLAEGLNEIKIYVYKSGVSKLYTLNIYRQPAAPNYQVSTQKLYVNGVAKTLYAVNIKGNNFLKLRDLAYVLSGTDKQFNVTYTESTNTAHIISNTAYVNNPQNPVNQPIVLSKPQLSSQKITVDGQAAYPIAYNVAGSNYVNLRQICAILDIGLSYSATTNAITITTANSYMPGL